MNTENSDYLKIWEIEQSDIKLRWTIVTFFMTVSFAIFSYSMQGKLQVVPLYLQQVLALLVFWFAFFIHLFLYRYTMFLRKYLRKMEENNETTLKLRTDADNKLSGLLNISITTLLLMLGVMYTVIIMITIYLTS